MTSFASILALGFLLGLRHATDADHVAAVTTIVARERRLSASALVGAAWGAGHMLTLLAVGGVIVAFRLAVPARVGIVLELAVAAMLVGLGLAAMSCTRAGRGTRRRAAADPPHVHAFVRGRLPRLAGHVAIRPLAIGIVHGAAGSGAVSLLVLSTIDDARWQLLYLTVFGLGTVAGMIALTTAIALPFAVTAARFERWSVWLVRGTGLASVGLGVAVAYQLLVMPGSLDSTPR
jgi:high-affinity nickel-transport protein